MKDKLEIRSMLAEDVTSLFDDIDQSRVLGANAQIRLMQRMMKSVVEHDDADGIESVRSQVRDLVDYYKGTRGQNSRAIYNALGVMTARAFSEDVVDRGVFVEMLLHDIDSFQEENEEDVRRLVSFAVNVCSSFSRVMCFDYSSTVEAFIRALPTNVVVTIPESRALNGGAPFLAGAVESGHTVRFIPDTCMMDELAVCDAAFIGADTVYADGTTFNTIGSDILAVVAKHLGRPFYVLTPLLKLDLRAVEGRRRLRPMEFDYKKRLGEVIAPELSESIDCSGIKLVSVPGNLISAVICERGVIPPSGLFPIALEYGKRLGEEI